MMIQNYLKYVHKHLGLSGVMLTPEIIESSMAKAALENSSNAPVNNAATNTASVEVASEAPFSAIPPLETTSSLPLVFEAEESYDPSKNYLAIFLRIGDVYPSLKNDPHAEELFSKLRGALGFKPESAPWVEASLGHWQPVLQVIRKQGRRVILMLDDTLEKSVADRPEWIIPDPAVLIRQIKLKRPTWDLLKEWKA